MIKADFYIAHGLSQYLINNHRDAVYGVNRVVFVIIRLIQSRPQKEFARSAAAYGQLGDADDAVAVILQKSGQFFPGFRSNAHGSSLYKVFAGRAAKRRGPRGQCFR